MRILENCNLILIIPRDKSDTPGNASTAGILGDRGITIYLIIPITSRNHNDHNVKKH